MIYAGVLGSGGISGADVAFGVSDFDSPTTTGNLDVTDSNMGVTPKAALVIATRHVATNDPSDTGSVAMSIGVTDGTNEYAAGILSRDGQASTFTGSSHDGARVIDLPNIGSVSTQEEATASFISNGIRLNYTTVNSIARRGTAVMFGGADCEAKTGFLESIGDVDEDVVVTGLGFRPDFIIFLGGHTEFGNTFLTYAHIGLGWASRVAGQQAVSWGENTGSASGVPIQYLDNAHCFIKHSASNNALLYNMEVSAWGSDGFTVSIDQTAGSTTNDVAYLAIKLGASDAKALDLDTPTSTGEVAYNTPGFTPGLVLGLTTNLTTRQDAVTSTTSNMSSLGVCAFTANVSKSAVARIDSGAGTTNTAIDVKSNALQSGNDTSTTAIVASLTSMDQQGFTLDWTSVDATARAYQIMALQAGS